MVRLTTCAWPAKGYVVKEVCVCQDGRSISVSAHLGEKERRVIEVSMTMICASVEGLMFLSRTHAQGVKQSVLSVVVTKIARSQ